MDSAVYGLIEAGGTKFVLGVADREGTILARYRIPTTSPAETLSVAVEWFRSQERTYAGFGVASFGPLCLDRSSPDWGCTTRTPKVGWSDANLVRPFAEAFECPVSIDTDVNGAALAESRWGAGKGKKLCVYLTIGTGVGGGAVAEGKILQGLSHPEMGHMRLPRHSDDIDFEGVCPFHGACLEGLASGPAIIARWGKSLSELPAGGAEQRMIAWYLAQGICNLQALLEPDCIIVGGGVMATEGLLDLVRAEAERIGGGYFVGNPHEIVTAPGLGDNAGLMGAYALAVSAS